MSNSYLSFACDWPRHGSGDAATKEEIDWLENQTNEELLYAFIEDSSNKENMALADAFSQSDWVGFYWHVEENENGKFIIFKSEESGSPEHLAILIKAFLAKFHPDKSLGFSWAYYDDNIELDGQGGGAAFITAKEIKYVDAYNWIDNEIKQYRKDKKNENDENNSASS